MSKALKLNSEFGLYSKDDEPMCSSLQIAELFGKEHKRVLQDIRNLGCSDNFRVQMFRVVYKEATGVTIKSKTKEVLMTSAGFALLVMGFTGDLALKVKENYAMTLGDGDAESIWSALVDEASKNNGVGQKKSFVYFLENKDDGLIKIGKADDVQARIRTINGMNPHDLSLLGSLECSNSKKAYEVEASLHRRFTLRKGSSEWFEPTADLLDFIASLTTGKSND